MPRDERHVTPNPDGGWDVVKPGSDRASTHHDRQSDAIDRARVSWRCPKPPSPVRAGQEVGLVLNVGLPVAAPTTV